MGLTAVSAKVGRGRKAVELQFLVDSGATYTLLPQRVWKRLGLKPMYVQRFALADSTVITRPVSEVWLEYNGRGHTVQVILGKSRDEPLLGSLTLEALGLVLNPFTRELHPARLMLA